MKLEIKEDKRGKLMEVFHFPNDGQVLYSTSKPGVFRGNHYHKRKKEVFCVIEGKGLINLMNRQTGGRVNILVYGDKPELIEMPVNWVHNIVNVGDKEMRLLIWANEVFNPDDPDTYQDDTNSILPA